jgi:hypothetical protein
MKVFQAKMKGFGTATAPVMKLDSLNGPVTQSEIDSFKAFMKTVLLP